VRTGTGTGTFGGGGPAPGQSGGDEVFGGLTNQVVAKILGVTERTVERQWAYAKAWLLQSIRQQL